MQLIAKQVSATFNIESRFAFDADVAALGACPNRSGGELVCMNESAQDLHIGSTEPTNSLSNSAGFWLSVQNLYMHTGFSAV